MSLKASAIRDLIWFAPRVTGFAQERLIPPGEGWVRFNDEMLWDPMSTDADWEFGNGEALHT